MAEDASYFERVQALLPDLALSSQVLYAGAWKRAEAVGCGDDPEPTVTGVGRLLLESGAKPSTASLYARVYVRIRRALATADVQATPGAELRTLAPREERALVHYCVRERGVAKRTAQTYLTLYGQFCRAADKAGASLEEHARSPTVPQRQSTAIRAVRDYLAHGVQAAKQAKVAKAAIPATVRELLRGITVHHRGHVQRLTTLTWADFAQRSIMELRTDNHMGPHYVLRLSDALIVLGPVNGGLHPWQLWRQSWAAPMYPDAPLFPTTMGGDTPMTEAQLWPLLKP